MRFAPVTTSNATAAVGAASVLFTTVMEANATYLFVSSTACHILQGAAPTAAAGTSMYVPAGVVLPIDGALGARLAVIQAAAGGTASLTRARKV
jgi:hypothetical protein